MNRNGRVNVVRGDIKGTRGTPQGHAHTKYKIWSQYKSKQNEDVQYIYKNDASCLEAAWLKA